MGSWTPDSAPPAFSAEDLLRVVPRVRAPALIIRQQQSQGSLGIGVAGQISPDPKEHPFPLLSSLPALYPEWLGDRAFLETHGLRFPYVGGAMANGISAPGMVIALARCGMLGFYGAGGLPLAQIEQALEQIQGELDLPGLPWGANLIHNPAEPQLEQAVADLFISRGVRRVSASAYMKLTPAVVRYACTGLRRDPAGRVLRRHHLLAKVSRLEVARLFMAPAPAKILEELLSRGELSAEEVSLAARVPLAGDITAEGDSGGHTDNRPLLTLLPALIQLRDQAQQEHRYDVPLRVGAAGGLGTPAAVASAFAMGAAYVLTGSVNQGALESGISSAAKEMLARADLADMTMAPSPDMFELGIKVQVLKRETLFSQRAAKLYALYMAHDSIESLPAATRDKLEQDIFKAPLDAVWEETRCFFEDRCPQEIERAGKDAKHRLALVFRWYLGNASKWAIEGDEGRRLDYQIWCGPAMGAFNHWTAGSFLASAQNRTVDQIARNLLEGAAVITRAHQLRSFGVPVPPAAFLFQPRPLS